MYYSGVELNAQVKYKYIKIVLKNSTLVNALIYFPLLNCLNFVRVLMKKSRTYFHPCATNLYQDGDRHLVCDSC